VLMDGEPCVPISCLISMHKGRIHPTYWSLRTRKKSIGKKKNQPPCDGWFL